MCVCVGLMRSMQSAAGNAAQDTRGCDTPTLREIHMAMSPASGGRATRDRGSINWGLVPCGNGVEEARVIHAPCTRAAEPLGILALMFM